MQLWHDRYANIPFIELVEASHCHHLHLRRLRRKPRDYALVCVWKPNLEIRTFALGQLLCLSLSIHRLDRLGNPGIRFVNEVEPATKVDR